MKTTPCRTSDCQLRCKRTSRKRLKSPKTVAFQIAAECNSAFSHTIPRRSKQNVTKKQLTACSLKGVVAERCEVGEVGRDWSELRAKPRGFLRGLSPTPATHFKCSNLLPHPSLNSASAVKPMCLSARKAQSKSRPVRGKRKSYEFCRGLGAWVGLVNANTQSSRNDIAVFLLST